MKMELKNDKMMGEMMDTWNGLMDVIFFGDMVSEKWWWKMDMVDGDMMGEKWLNQPPPKATNYCIIVMILTISIRV